MSMGRRYCTHGTAPVANPTASLLGITSGGSNLKKPSIYDFYLGASMTPADYALLWKWQRYTAAGTATSRTPSPLDPGDTASDCTSGYAHSAEPTYTSGILLFWLALNSRATHKAYLDPNGPLVGAATSNNGMGLYAVSTVTTGQVDATAYFFE